MFKRHKKKLYKSLLVYGLAKGMSKGFPKGLLGILLIGGISGGIIGGLWKFMSKGTMKKLKPQMAGGISGEIGSGVYGAVAIAKAFKGADFPMSKQDIMEKYGDREIEFHRGHREKVRNVLAVIPNETFNSTIDVEHAFREFSERKE